MDAEGSVEAADALELAAAVESVSGRMLAGAVARTRRASRFASAFVRTESDLRRTARSGARDLAVFHEFVPPPTGGGHQFLRALCGELGRRGIDLELNTISPGTPACLFNSFNFDFRRLRRFARRGARMVHRVDGPIGVYRGHDDGTDLRLAQLNSELAAATIFQSHWSLARHRELGLELCEPVVIPNAADPAIFHPREAPRLLGDGPLRIIVSSWSNNPRKGLDALRWLDANLDPGRFSVTFVGRAADEFTRLHRVPAVPSVELAALLREHDAYLAASLDDPCSNALIEALSCGLPAVFRRSGGHPELVAAGGVGFDRADELGEAFETLRADLEGYRAAISVPRLDDVASRYLQVLGL